MALSIKPYIENKEKNPSHRHRRRIHELARRTAAEQGATGFGFRPSALDVTARLEALGAKSPTSTSRRT